jgi:hypothetical protein
MSGLRTTMMRRLRSERARFWVPMICGVVVLTVACGFWPVIATTVSVRTLPSWHEAGWLYWVDDTRWETLWWPLTLEAWIDSYDYYFPRAAVVLALPMLVFLCVVKVWWPRRGLAVANQNTDDGDPMLWWLRVVVGNRFVDEIGEPLVRGAHVESGGAIPVERSWRVLRTVMREYAKWRADNWQHWWQYSRHVSAAWWAVRTGNWERAEQRSLVAIAANDEDMHAASNLAHALWAQGRRDEAWALYQSFTGKTCTCADCAREPEHALTGETMMIGDFARMHDVGVLTEEFLPVVRLFTDDPP